MNPSQRSVVSSEEQSRAQTGVFICLDTIAELLIDAENTESVGAFVQKNEATLRSLRECIEETIRVLRDDSYWDPADA